MPRVERETPPMIYPIPSGTRDVLPEETREVRAITDTLRGVFERHGYGEVYTPALEYEAVLARADMAEARPAYRVFDEAGAVLVLRSDMTVPIARVVATRYAASEPPLRFCYFAHCYRGVRPQRGQPRRSEEHTSELQSRRDLVCRLLLEKKKKTISTVHTQKQKKRKLTPNV